MLRKFNTGFWVLRRWKSSYQLRISIFTQNQHLVDLSRINSRVNPFFSSFSYIFDLTYHFFRSTCNFLYEKHQNIKIVKRLGQNEELKVVDLKMYVVKFALISHLRSPVLSRRRPLGCEMNVENLSWDKNYNLTITLFPQGFLSKNYQKLHVHLKNDNLSQRHKINC